jgi:hypothetical protein
MLLSASRVVGKRRNPTTSYDTPDSGGSAADPSTALYCQGRDVAVGSGPTARRDGRMMILLPNKVSLCIERVKPDI